MVPRLILELFRTAPAELLSKDLPQIMKIVADMADDDGKFFIFFFFIENQLKKIIRYLLGDLGKIPVINKYWFF